MMIRLAPLFATLLLPVVSWSVEINGFDTSSKIMNENTVVRVGPVNSPTAAIDQVKTESVSNTNWSDGDYVMGLALNGEARAYPLSVMLWHQIINDELGGVPVLVTFCQICGTGLIYDRVINDKPHTFGMSGLIYHADILLYDKESQSLWSRFLDESVAGPSEGQPIFDLPFLTMTLGEWKQRYPQSSIISRDTGFDINYSMTPAGTSSAGDKVFAALPTELRYHPNMPVVGVNRNGKTKAYPAGEVLVDGGQISDRFEGADISIQYTAKSQSFTLDISPQSDIKQTTWSAWNSQHPKTAIYVSSAEVQ